MKAIEVKNLIVEFDVTDAEGIVKSKRKILDGINLTVNEGEFVCVLGRNGSGKSTFAKCLNALLLPSSGDVYVYGINTKDENRVIDIRQKVGMTFQNPDNQIVASIVEEDVAFGLENIGVKTSDLRVRIDDAMKSIGIYDLKDNMVSKLSGGQKQKVSIAGILAMKPKIIVLDEPTSMIDKAGRIDLLNTVKRLNKEEKITIILISHYVEEMSYADRVVLLDNGKITLDDTPKSILLRKDELNEAGIDMPYISGLATELKARGKNLKGNEETVFELCQYLK